MSGFNDRYLNFGDVYSIIMQAKTIDQAMNVLHLPYVEMPKWIPVTKSLPEELKPVNITYINEDPAPYYEHIKGIPFTATAIYYRGGWYWWSCTCADVLAEYGHSYSDSMDEGIEVTAWMPLPKPYAHDEC